MTAAEGLIMYQAQVFVATKVPTQHEVHCLVAHLTDKRQVSVKVVRNGRVVSIVSSAGGISPKSVRLDTNAFDFKRTEAVPPYATAAGDVATVSTHLCYTIKKTAPRGGKCATLTPIDVYGRIKPDLREHFLRYLESQTGLVGLVEGAAEIGITPDHIPTADERVSKVWFVGSMQLTIRARVGNPTVFNALSGNAIGNRRSYGFGAISCDLIEKFTALEAATA